MSRLRCPVIGRSILVAFGANLGDPRETFDWTYRRLDAVAGVEAVSDQYWTEPVGGPPGQPPYLNAVFKLGHPPEWVDAHACLADLQAIEGAAGRTRRLRWEARTLDLDLLDGFPVEDSADLTLPHPRMMERAFVLQPLLDVAPNWVHPITAVSVSDALMDLQREEGAAGVTAGGRTS